MLKTIGAVALVAGGVGVFGAVAGWWSPDVKPNVSPEVTQKVEDITQDALQGAKEQTNKAFDSLSQRIKKSDDGK